MKGDKIFPACDRHSVEAVTLNKYVAEYEQMRKLTVKFQSKFHGRGIKIARVNLMHIANHKFY